MTLFPFDERYKVAGAVGPTYTIQGICSHPDCDETNVERHHLCRRSALGGPFDWIEYEGVLIQNVVGLCREHHRQVTDNEARIWWTPLAYFAWVQRGQLEKLNPHPLIDDGSHSHAELEKAEVVPDVCPGCGRPVRKKSAREHEEKRPREKWTIHVPKDERENGADILDTLLEEARRLMALSGLPYGDEDNARYFVLSAVLGLFVQHAQEVLSDS